MNLIKNLLFKIRINYIIFKLSYFKDNNFLFKNIKLKFFLILLLYKLKTLNILELNMILNYNFLT